jgi:glycosyltransferase involved in cell wall biosynthesis
MKFSIVIPSYNQGKFIEDTIISVIQQDYLEKELIVIDGGSKDNTIDIIKKYEKYISYWVSEPDNGQANAINKGFEKSSGDILYYINSDDVLSEGALSNVAKVFSKYKKYDLVAGHSFLFNDSVRHPIGKIFSCSNNYIEMLIMGSSLTQPSVFFTRRAYENAGPFDESFFFSMDYEYWIRLLYKGFKLKIINKFLSYVRIHNDSKSSNYRDIKEKEDEIVRNKYYEIIKTNRYKYVYWRIKRGVMRRLYNFLL